VPDLCQSIADLAGLADLVRRKNSKLQAINGGRGTDSVPGHHLFNKLQTLKTSVSFHFVPIPGASNFAHGVKLRFRILRRVAFSGPAFLVLPEPIFTLRLRWPAGTSVDSLIIEDVAIGRLDFCGAGDGLESARWLVWMYCRLLVSVS